MKSRKKLVFVLPEYDEKASTHFVHTLGLVDEAGKTMDVLLFIEYANGCPRLKHIKRVYCQRFTFPFFSFIERFLCFLWFRLAGWKNLYVHYSYWSGLIGGLIYRLTFGKFYYWHCEAYANYGGDRRWYDLKWRLRDDIPMRLCMKLCSHLVTGTASMKDFYAQYFHVKRQKIKILPNSLNLDRFKPCLKNPRQIAFVHWMAPRKGADLLPEIIEKCLNQSDDFIFVIVGDGPLLPSVRKATERFGDHVRFTGALPNEQAMAIIAESELFIMPSRQEGFPRVLVESMALGTAFVATDVGGVRDIVSDDVELVAPEEVDAFVHEILRVISDSNLKKALVESGLVQAQNFSHIKAAKLLHHLL
ncbi:hypothetical protein AUK45_03395 [Candidatus Peregrinibacteria bacterium CG2_30_44_17]|nr:MAG: hypothetical protein AUK45_03395 [Candidatus Peregrinibacteria bacterium CG2_30_44_17]